MSSVDDAGQLALPNLVEAEVAYMARSAARPAPILPPWGAAPMPVPTNLPGATRPTILGVAILMAAGLSPGRVEADGPGPRTWTLSDAHDNAIVHLAFSPDGRILASADQDGRIKLWAPATGRVRVTLETRLTQRDVPMAFSPDGRVLASGLGTGQEPAEWGGIRLWDAATGRPLRDFKIPPSYLRRLVYSRDGRLLAVATSQGTARLWDIDADRQRAEIHSDPYTPMAFSPDFKLAATVDRWSHAIRLVDVEAGRERARLVGHKNEISSLAFSPDGRTLASGAPMPLARRGDLGPDYPSELKLWDLAGDPPRERASLTGPPSPAGPRLNTGGLAFSPDSRLVVAGGQVRDAGSGALVADLAGSSYYVGMPTFSPDGSLLAGGGSLGICLWETRSWKKRVELDGPYADRLAYTPDGKTLAAGLSDGAVRLHDVAAGRDRMVLLAHPGRVRGLAISRDGRRLAAGGANGLIAMWEPETGRRLGIPHIRHAGEVTALAISPDGRMLASGGKDTTVRLYDLGSRLQVARLDGHQAEVSAVAFSPDGKTLVSAGHDGLIRLWDVAGHREGAAIRGHTYRLSRLKPRIVDGKPVLSGEPIPVEWEEHQVPIYCLAYSPDGRTLAVGDRAMYGAGGVSLRDGATGRERAVFQKFRGEPHVDLEDVNALAYSPDGRILASAGYNTIHLSDADTGRERATLRTGRTSPLRDLAFSPDGKTLAAGSYQVVQFWDVPSALKGASSD